MPNKMETYEEGTQFDEANKRLKVN